jgi:hypothetical protein
LDGVVVLKPSGQALQDGDGVGPWVHADVVALEGLHESLADAVALGTADGREAGDEVQRDDEVGGLAGGVGEAVVGQPLHGLQRAPPASPADDRHARVSS